MRRIVACVLVMLVMLVPMSAASAATTVEGAGTAETRLDLLSVELDVSGPLADLVAAVEALDLVTATSFASLDADAARNVAGNGEPFARSALTLPVVGDLEARSDGTTRHGGDEIALPAGLGSLRLAGLLATVEDGEARALVDALTGHVDITVGGVTAKVPGDTAGARVNAQGATAGNGAVIEDLSLALGDLLPPELLALLPLEAVLDLIAALPVDSGELGATVEQLAAIRATAAELNALRDEVVNVITRLGDALAPADAALASGSGLDADALADLVADLDAVLADLDDLLETIVDGLNDILDRLAALDLDLEGLLRQIVDNLAALELVTVERLGVTVDARAAADASSAAVDCGVQGVRVLGAALPDVGTCAELRDALASLRVSILGILDALPVAGSVTGDLVHIDGLRATTTPDNAADGSYNVAEATLSALELEVGSIDLAATVDALVEGLLDELAALLDLLDGDLLDGLGLAATGASDGDLDALLRALLGNGVPALDSGLDELIGGLDGVRASSASNDEDRTDEVRDVLASLAGQGITAPAGFGQASDELAALRDALEALPTGAALEGLATPGLRVTALGLSSTAEFAGVPVTPTPSEDLPRTGGGLGPLALLLLAAGGFARVVAHRRD